MRTLILISLVFLVGCHQNENVPNVVGIYKTMGFNSAAEITLAPNHKFKEEIFSSDCFGSSSVSVILGSYIVQNNYVLLTPTNYSEKFYKRLAGKEKLLLDTVYTIGSLEYFNDSLAVIGWNKRLYLIATNDFQSAEYSMPSVISFFINNINSGSLNTEYGPANFKRAYWNRICPDCTETNLKKALPQKYRDYLLDTALQTQILALEKRATWPEDLATITGGLKNGVRKGMIFYSQASDCYRYLQVIEVYQTYSKAVANGTCKPKKSIPYTTQFESN